MQAEQLQGLQKQLLAVRENREQLQNREKEELLKSGIEMARLDLLQTGIAALNTAEQQLLRSQERLEAHPQPGGEQWGTAPGAWWQAAHLVLGPSSILRPEEPFSISR